MNSGSVNLAIPSQLIEMSNLVCERNSRKPELLVAGDGLALPCYVKCFINSEISSKL